MMVLYDRLKGRARRGEFWAFIGGIFVITLVARLGPSVIETVAGFGTFAIWLYAAIRRLHDFNRSGWWSLLPFGLSFVSTFIPSFMEGVGAPLAAGTPETMIGVAGLVSVGVIVAIGAWPGTKGPNRFDPPGAASVAEVF